MPKEADWDWLTELPPNLIIPRQKVGGDSLSLSLFSLSSLEETKEREGELYCITKVNRENMHAGNIVTQHIYDRKEQDSVARMRFSDILWVSYPWQVSQF